MSQLQFNVGEPEHLCPTCNGAGTVHDSVFRTVTARNSDPDTSHTARKDSKDVRKFKAGSSNARLLKVICDQPCTSQAAAVQVKRFHGTVSSLDGCRRRVSDLAKAGFVIDSGRRAKNPGSSSPSIVYQVTLMGRQALENLERTGWSK